MLVFVGNIRGVLEVLVHVGGNEQAQHQQTDCGSHPDSQTVLASVLAECVSDIRPCCCLPLQRSHTLQTLLSTSIATVGCAEVETS